MAKVYFNSITSWRGNMLLFYLKSKLPFSVPYLKLGIQRRIADNWMCLCAVV